MSVPVEYDGRGHTIDHPTGVIQGIFWEPIDLGISPDKFHPGKTKHQAILLWQLNETFEIEGKQQRFVQTEFVNLTLAPKAKLRRFTEGMLGKTVEQLLAEIKAKGGTKINLDLERLKGINCMLTIKKKDGKSGEDGYTEIESIAPLMKGLAKMELIDMPRPKWIDDFVEGLKDDAPVDQATDVDMQDIMGDI